MMILLAPNAINVPGLEFEVGREIIASRDHTNVAAAAGINPAATKLLVLVIAACFAASSIKAGSARRGAGRAHTLGNDGVGASIIQFGR
jgi:ribose/xylose/arabinose/galactoside ABC-type transport system permease subunit